MKHKKLSAEIYLEKLSRSLAFFTRISLIVCVSIIVVCCASPIIVINVCESLITFFGGTLTAAVQKNTFITIFGILFYCFYFICIFFCCLYFIFYKKSVKNKYIVKFTAVDFISFLYSLLAMIIFTIIPLICVKFYDWSITMNDVLLDFTCKPSLIEYIFPILSLFCFIPLLLIDIISFVNFTVRLYCINNSMVNEQKQRSIVLKYYNVCLSVICVTFIVCLCGVPESILYMWGIFLKYDNISLLAISKWLLLYGIFVFIIFTLFFKIVLFCKHIIISTKYKHDSLQWDELFIRLGVILIILFFLLSFSVFNLWLTPADDEDITGMLDGISVVSYIYFVFLLIITVYYSKYVGDKRLSLDIDMKKHAKIK